MTVRRTLVLASGNPHKLEELQSAMPGWEVRALDRADYPPETGSTYRANAAAKARFGRLHANPHAWVLGEDSGIEVTALGGLPGVESARWAENGVGRTLEELEGATDRRARYVCVLVALAPDGAEAVTEGELAGEIVTGPPRGCEGFGYDPIFVPRGGTLTVAELGDTWKRAHYHRAAAAAALARALDLSGPAAPGTVC